MSIYDFNKEKQDYTTAFYELLLSVMTSGGSGLDISAPRLTLIGTVKLKIDELQTKKEGVQFIDTSSDTAILDMYINGLLDESAKHVLQTAPLHMIEPTEDFSAVVTVNPDDATVGHVFMPADYLRFVSLQMGSWKQEVTRPILTTDSKYKKQKYIATRGGTAKPVVVLNTARIGDGSTVAQVDTVTVSGDSGVAYINVAGLSLGMFFQNNLLDVIATFANDHDAALQAEGITVTHDGVSDLIFTANVAGVPFASPWTSTSTGNLTGTTVHTTPNQKAYDISRVM